MRVRSVSARCMLVALGALVIATIGSACAKHPATSASAEEACTPAKLGLAAPTAPMMSWNVPRGCQAADAMNAAPRIVTSEAAYQAYFRCETAAPSGIDFAAHSLIVASRMLSPATVGIGMLDDGAKVTFVNETRAACPNDPMPVPVLFPIAALAPAGASRTFGDTACSVPSSCD